MAWQALPRLWIVDYLNVLSAKDTRHLLKYTAAQAWSFCDALHSSSQYRLWSNADCGGRRGTRRRM